MRSHGNLGAGSRIAGCSLDLDDAFFNLRHFEFEEFLDEFRGSARKDHSTSLRRIAHMIDVGANAVAGAHVFARDHLVARQTRFKTAHFNNRIALVHTLDRTGHDRFVAFEKFREDLFTLCVAQTLQNHLLGVLSKAAAGRVNIHVLKRTFDIVSRLQIRKFIVNVRIHFLMIGLLQPFFIGHNEPAAHGGKFTGRAVNPHDNVGVFARETSALHGARQSQFENAEYDVLSNVLFACEHVNELEHIAAVHWCITL